MCQGSENPQMYAVLALLGEHTATEADLPTRNAIQAQTLQFTHRCDRRQGLQPHGFGRARSPGPSVSRQCRASPACSAAEGARRCNAARRDPAPHKKNSWPAPGAASGAGCRGSSEHDGNGGRCWRRRASSLLVEPMKVGEIRAGWGCHFRMGRSLRPCGCSSFSRQPRSSVKVSCTTAACRARGVGSRSHSVGPPSDRRFLVGGEQDRPSAGAAALPAHGVAWCRFFRSLWAFTRAEQ